MKIQIKGMTPELWGDVGSLPRSGYTEQPRALALGQAVREGALKVAPDVALNGWNETRTT
jgi:hypothetical protein